MEKKGAGGDVGPEFNAVIPLAFVFDEFEIRLGGNS